jgi:hypothetical protein
MNHEKREWLPAYRALMRALSPEQGFALVRALHAHCIEAGCIPCECLDWPGMPNLRSGDTARSERALEVYHTASAALRIEHY